MNESHRSEGRYRVYWVTWGILLVITAFMLVTDGLSWPKNLLIGLLLFAMMVKALIIGGEFMHLRFERPGLILGVAGTILFFSLFLFVLISYDAMRIHRMVLP